MRKLRSIAVLMISFFPSIRSLSTAKLVPSMSGMTKITMFGRDVFVKRDDDHFHPESCLNGNKRRKFMNLLENDAIPSNLISYGGVQSNSLAALCKVASYKRRKLWYVTNPIPARVKRCPTGSYKLALESNASIIEAERETYQKLVSWCESEALRTNYPEDFSSLFPTGVLSDCKWVRQGGAIPEAKEGVEQLGSELASFIENSSLSGPWKILVASGTGTTALFLANYFAERGIQVSEKCVEVMTVPCVGSAEYLSEQMVALASLSEAIAEKGSGRHLSFPTIISSERGPKRVFAKPYKDHLLIWNELQRQSGINFDLIYAPRTVEVLLSQCNKEGANLQDLSLKGLFPGENLIYYHCGGTEGNPSQLDRYKILGLL